MNHDLPGLKVYSVKVASHVYYTRILHTFKVLNSHATIHIPVETLIARMTHTDMHTHKHTHISMNRIEYVGYERGML